MRPPELFDVRASLPFLSPWEKGRYQDAPHEVATTRRRMEENTSCSQLLRVKKLQ